MDGPSKDENWTWPNKGSVEEAKNGIDKLIKRAAECLNKPPILESHVSSASDASEKTRVQGMSKPQSFQLKPIKPNFEMKKKHLLISKTTCGSTKLSNPWMQTWLHFPLRNSSFPCFPFLLDPVSRVPAPAGKRGSMIQRIFLVFLLL